MKGNFKNSLQYDWLKYTAVIILSVALWIFAFNIYHAPKDYQQLNLFFVGTVKNYNFEAEAANACEVKKFTIISANPDDSVFYQKYATVGLNMCDVIIAPYSIAKETAWNGTAIELSETYGLKTFVQQDKCFGVYLPESAKNSLAKYFTFNDEDYVVFISAASVNAGEKSSACFLLIEYLVNYGKI